LSSNFQLIHDEQGALCAAWPAELKLKPIKVDFLHGRFADRLKRHSGLKEPLARAIGLHKKEALSVIDATAGFGREGMLLALLGCSVFMIEQSHIMAALLQDGLIRARADAVFPTLIKHWVECIEGNAQEWIPKLVAMHSIDVIYLDPMFPSRTKTAAVKKEMQFLHAIVGTQSNDDEALFTVALNAAVERVVVKRPVHAPPLAGKKPNYVIDAGQMRFDVYTKAK
jgi:16S rRNA (guanine1516-N2)-methyltransferase